MEIEILQGIAILIECVGMVLGFLFVREIFTRIEVVCKRAN